MPNSTPPLAVGTHRPVYLWAGPGTIRMNRLKFMNAPVNEAVHEEAHALQGAVRIVQEARCNWAYLTYDWGFPPEIETQDWEAFRQAAQVYHSAGARVFGYIQTSNYVYAGSYLERDWYARDPRGRPFPYYTGRYMSCWRHPHWRAHLHEMVEGVIAAGADGVFFDNPWYGMAPQHSAGAWLGGAGCYCERCRAAFRAATGSEIPRALAPETDEASRVYLRWRADQVTATLAELADHARRLNPAILISANDFDAVMRPSFVTYGIDLAGLAHVQDVVMIEDYGLVHWRPEAAELINNALTLRTARALIGETHLSVEPYDQGIGFDQVYAPRRYQQAIAEAAAGGASMVVKGTEFVEADGTFTLLTAEEYAPQREAIGAMHRWLIEMAPRYTERQNLAPVGLLHSGDALWQRWDRVAPLYFSAGQALLMQRVPWRVVTPEDDLSALTVLLHSAPLPHDLRVPDTVRVVSLAALPGWVRPTPSFVARHPVIRRLYASFAEALFRAYFKRRWARRLVDRLGLTQKHFIPRSMAFGIPSVTRQTALLSALGPLPGPRVTAAAPVLVEHWLQGNTRQLHLVNYAGTPQQITVVFEQPVSGEVLRPEKAPASFQGQTFEDELDVTLVLCYTP
ncbi:MAG TPA: hypothetical protein PLJ24_01365 [Anaerolineae bacterium]|nr:hypothetical protein [Anaerolineae bacterium]